MKLFFEKKQKPSNKQLQMSLALHQNTDVAIASIGSCSVQLSQEDEQIDDNADLGVESERNEGTSSILNLGPSESGSERQINDIQLSYLGSNNTENSCNINHIKEDKSDDCKSHIESSGWSRKAILEWIFVLTNFALELPSAVLDQLSSVGKPQYALFAMLISFAAVFICFVELIYKVDDDDDPLPAVEGLQISGEAFPGRELQACGYSINGTTNCIFEDYVLTGAKQPNYLVTANDVDTYLAVEVWPLDDKDRKGELVKVFANEHRKIACDPEMHNYIEKTFYTGHASYRVSVSTGYLDIWEPPTLTIKRGGYYIKCTGPSGLVVTEKFFTNHNCHNSLWKCYRITDNCISYEQIAVQHMLVV
ncbi:Tripartite motif-containing 29 [Melia azedarach]|uniref:Tripartite motif-containing 29 n=1 Tax=Melia azedarach TaxID=155640 RepID=A0ACC1Y0V9_MELAZ|nr:Tripartite motif-containing 29 [Melia azedarach]